ncbi:PD-(D/E)XK nuclease family protein [Flaviflexus salsibiostraticola]|uniref:PD-(D/E)XK nuclease family protein n=1 Tax=Flaviflexus salsibiostraticola TaxID=1282737 RepID=A0A3S8Z6N4_9ACTO|nr:PD-(D/E)XK nuclease family protein [Flaviflexus salsibiostraticola]AZN29157.1 PD-(D/E)XK nuclease family protein [Flaviflexus salsibiostraticola]
MRYQPALSVSRLNDFKQCPLKFRYRVIDRVPEPPSPAATKGTLVHSVLEHLYDLPAHERTAGAADNLVEPRWAAMVERDPGIQRLFDDEPFEGWLESARSLVGVYFRRENPAMLNPTRSNRERMITVDLDSGVRFRGVIDRIDVSPQGDLRVVDYKTGRMPNPNYQHEALFQVRAYGLLLSKAEGRLPRQSQLIYLGSDSTLTYWSDEADNSIVEEAIVSVWSQILEALDTGRFEPRVSRLCDWCSFKALCPAFDGEEPPMSEEGALKLRAVQL